MCAKLEPASSKNNEILEINVLQKFTPRALLEHKTQLANFKELLNTVINSTTWHTVMTQTPFLQPGYFSDLT